MKSVTLVRGQRYGYMKPDGSSLTFERNVTQEVDDATAAILAKDSTKLVVGGEEELRYRFRVRSIAAPVQTQEELEDTEGDPDDDDFVSEEEDELGEPNEVDAPAAPSALPASVAKKVAAVRRPTKPKPPTA